MTNMSEYEKLREEIEEIKDTIIKLKRKYDDALENIDRDNLSEDLIKKIYHIDE